MQREPNTIYVLNLSYGKDSFGCLPVIEQLGLPLDRIVHAEVWATDTIPADLPPMVEFKVKADKIIKERWGIEVEHIYATKKVADMGGGCCRMTACFTLNQQPKNMETTSMVFPNSKVLGVSTGSNVSCLPKLTYEDIFYRTRKNGGVQEIRFPNSNQRTMVQQYAQSQPTRQIFTGFNATKHFFPKP